MPHHVGLFVTSSIHTVVLSSSLSTASLFSTSSTSSVGTTVLFSHAPVHSFRKFPQRRLSSLVQDACCAPLRQSTPSVYPSFVSFSILPFKFRRAKLVKDGFPIIPFWVHLSCDTDLESSAESTRKPTDEESGKPLSDPSVSGQELQQSAVSTDSQSTPTSSSSPSETEEVSSSDAVPLKLFQSVCATLRRWFAPPAFVVGLVFGITLSVILVLMPGSTSPRDALVREKVTLFDFILQDINDSYVEKVDINRLFETGINSMLGTLDPYTQFENNTQALEMSVKTNGRYAGVGLGLTLGDPDPSAQNTRPIVVVSAFEGYAFDAGVRPGDIIHSVSGTPVSGITLEKVTEMLRGDPGTEVNVTVSRHGFPAPLPFTLSRKSVHIKDVPAATFVGDFDDRIAYIRLQSFAKDAAKEVAEAIESFKANQHAIRGVVLDLRGNPGGLLNAAIEVAELFVPRGSTIVSTRGRGLGPSPTYISTRDPLLPTETPLAVLVNGQTASASEIVAGAVQDLDLGIVVGSRTFGKGLVQNVQELPFNTALKYTVGKYYTPSGRCIQAFNYEQSDGPFESRQVEESQRNEFRTRAGRIVRDGGGIEPDLDLHRRPSFLELALIRQNMYFHFATRFGADTKLDKLPDNFTVTDGIYKDFVKYVTSSGFKYESRFDDAFDQLDEMFKDVGYETARSKINDLKKVTNTEMRSDFLRHEHDIRSQLESAIRFRFQPDSQRIVAELKNDDQLAQTVGILKSQEKYLNLLEPKAEVASQTSLANG